MILIMVIKIISYHDFNNGFTLFTAVPVLFIIPRNDCNSFLHLGGGMSIGTLNFLGSGLVLYQDMCDTHEIQGKPRESLGN